MDLTLIKEDVKINNKKLSEKKKHFFFGKYKNIGIMRVLKRRSNIFVIFEDLKHKMVICKTSGSAGIVGTKRLKKTPQTIENIFNVIYPYLKLYNIKFINILLNTRVNACFYLLVRLLEDNFINIKEIRVQRKIAYNGCKGRKLRRI